MRYSGLICCLLLLFCAPVSAEPQQSVLFVYTTMDEGGELLYATLTHFYDEVEAVSLQDIQPYQLAEATQLIVYGTERADTAKLNHYKGKLLVIGKVAQRMTQFQQWTFGEDVVVRQIGDDILTQATTLTKINVQNGVLLAAQSLDEQLPVIIKQDDLALMSFNTLDDTALYYVSKYLGTILELELAPMHDAFILLRDIHPQTDPVLLAELGHYLLDRGIPVYLNVTPTYLDLVNEQSAVLQDAPPLLATLQSLAERGAFLVAGGYTNYFALETEAAGYEFWDVANDAAPYVDEQKEALYVQDKLIRSIHAFANVALTPVAFAAPQYRMSENGYKVSTYHYDLHIGQLQGRAPLFITKPRLLYGKTLFPDTLGLYDPDDYTFKQRFQQLRMVQGATISASYSVYSGLAPLQKLVALYDTLPNKTWLSLADWPISVQTAEVTITNESGTLTLQNNISLLDKARQLLQERPVEFMLWVIMIVTTIFVCLFSIYIVNMRLRYRKRLFEERDEW